MVRTPIWWPSINGLTPSEDQTTVNFWLDTVAGVYGAEEEADRQRIGWIRRRCSMVGSVAGGQG
jgi:hypothetical protein